MSVASRYSRRNNLITRKNSHSNGSSRKEKSRASTSPIATFNKTFARKNNCTLIDFILFRRPTGSSWMGNGKKRTCRHS